MEHFLLQLFIFLAAAAIAVPAAKKLGLGSVLGYLIAGIIIGPYGLSLIGDIEEVMHFTEFGVVMMLFLVGLELKPSLLWQMRVPIIGMGGAQVVLSTIAIGAPALFFLSWQESLAVGMILALSSTAIVLQTLREKGLMDTPPGRSVFSVLLFQDLAVIPMLALLPLLAAGAAHGGGHHGAGLFDIQALPVYLRILVTLLAIGFIFARQIRQQADLPGHRRHQGKGNFRRRRTGPGRRHLPADDHGRPVSGTGNLPCRSGPGQQRVSP
jgi:Kef-type K+ transport system membrane component KefB